MNIKPPTNSYIPGRNRKIPTDFCYLLNFFVSIFTECGVIFRKKEELYK